MVTLAGLLGCPAAFAAELLGTKPPEWKLSNWLNSTPLTLEGLRGNVVLVRWWTAPGCPYCAATAPALNEFDQTYRDQGLQVIGVYHHKSAEPFDMEKVKQRTARYGLQFPVAVDDDWQTLKRWWLDHDDRAWTSVSFLLDRTGKIRFIHPGGQYEKGDADYERLKKKIEELIAEPVAPAP